MYKQLLYVVVGVSTNQVLEQLDGFTSAFPALGLTTGIRDQLLSNSMVSADWSLSLRYFYRIKNCTSSSFEL